MGKEVRKFEGDTDTDLCSRFSPLMVVTRPRGGGDYTARFLYRGTGEDGKMVRGAYGISLPLLLFPPHGRDVLTGQRQAHHSASLGLADNGQTGEKKLRGNLEPQSDPFPAPG